jgi:hypothetical protein
MVKLLLILFLGGALANQIASANSAPPLLIDASPAPTQSAALDAAD